MGLCRCEIQNQANKLLQPGYLQAQLVPPPALFFWNTSGLSCKISLHVIIKRSQAQWGSSLDLMLPRLRPRWAGGLFLQKRTRVRAPHTIRFCFPNWVSRVLFIYCKSSMRRVWNMLWQTTTSDRVTMAWLTAFHQFQGDDNRPRATSWYTRWDLKCIYITHLHCSLSQLLLLFAPLQSQTPTRLGCRFLSQTQ